MIPCAGVLLLRSRAGSPYCNDDPAPLGRPRHEHHARRWSDSGGGHDERTFSNSTGAGDRRSITGTAAPARHRTRSRLYDRPTPRRRRRTHGGWPRCRNGTRPARAAIGPHVYKFHEFRLTVSAAQQGPEGGREAAQPGQDRQTLPSQGTPSGRGTERRSAGRQNTRSSQSATERVDPNVAAKRRST